MKNLFRLACLTLILVNCRPPGQSGSAQILNNVGLFMEAEGYIFEDVEGVIGYKGKEVTWVKVQMTADQLEVLGHSTYAIGLTQDAGSKSIAENQSKALLTINSELYKDWPPKGAVLYAGYTGERKSLAIYVLGGDVILIYSFGKK